MAREIHTTPNPDGEGWVNQMSGKIVSRYRTKLMAERAGRRLAIENGAEHVVHRRDGTIGQKNSYGTDPYPPAG